MAKTATNITQLAARLNLSKGTVSRILNDRTAPFAAETRLRVIAAAAEMGYRPNPIARALATGRTGSVAFWIRNLRTSYRARVAQVFEAQQEARAYRLIIRLFGRDLEQGNGGSGVLTLSESVDGIVTHGPPPTNWVHLAENASKRTPIIYTGTIPDPDAPDWVGVDLAGVSRQAVEHLLASGRKRIAHLTPYPTHSPGDERTQAYSSVMAQAGLAPEMLRVESALRADIRQSVRDYITSQGCPEALFCYNDESAIAAYRALCDLGLRVPDDIALVGCDGIEDTEYLAVPISTIVLPTVETCRLAWQFLERRMQDPDAPPQRIVLQPTFVIRESSGA